MFEIQENIDLHSFTTFRVGGRARFFVEAKTEDDLIEALRFASDKNIAVFVLGGGSNVLFSDKGWDGLVIRVALADMTVSDDGRIAIGAGAPLARLVETAHERGFAGVERLAGIPGTIGGAVRGNAGAFGFETAQTLQLARALDRTTLSVSEFPKAACEFDYRTSRFKRNPNLVVLSAVFALAPGADRDALGRSMRETIATREEKHPQRLLCAGSFFMNPSVSKAALREEFERDTGMKLKDDKIPAGWLIDFVGLRGREVGGARVSDIHPNYLINTGTATAESILILASIVKQRVRSELGVILREEVQMVGF